MNPLVGSISLQHQAARAFGIIRIILNQHGTCQAVDDITCLDLVRGEFFVTVN